MTHKQQSAQLHKAIKRFIKAQRTATAALTKITEIALCENEGNPLECALQGEGQLIGYATIDSLGSPCASGEFNEAIECASLAISANGYVA